MKLIFSKGTSLRLQLFFSLVTAALFIIFDARYQSFRIVRYYLDTAISPLYHLSDSPYRLFDSMLEMKKEREMLIADNGRLKRQLLLKNSELLLLSQLKHENNRLRLLLDSPLRRDEKKMVAQVILADSNPYSYQIVINKGASNGVFVGQPVIDEKGVIGQIFAISKSTSRAILICDYQHAIPVRILRNDMSMIAAGNGCENKLTLDFLPNDVDVKIGDQLVTSGLDGRFPEGYPVATIVSIRVDPDDAHLVVEATPAADLKRLRYLLLLWDPYQLMTKETINVAPELGQSNENKEVISEKVSIINKR